MREKIKSGIKKVDSIFFIGKKKSLDKEIINSKKPTIFVKMSYNKNILKNIKNKEVLAFTGIAHPENFFNSIDDLGLNIVKKIQFSDHYMYKQKDFENIISLSKNLKLTALTTEKDFVKVPDKFKERIIALPLQVQFNKDFFYKLFMQKLTKND